MGRVKHICETCVYWVREHKHKTVDGKNVYARCLMRIYSRWATDKCGLWEKMEIK